MLNSKKTYYSIREVCETTGLEPHVLRYWESEFPLLRPKKNRAGNRAYREKDIEVINTIKRLLYEEQFTIPGAKKKLANIIKEKDDEDVDGEHGLESNKAKPVVVGEIREGLREVLKILKV
jgi:DNA-binding transcriptional MerR regulator